MSKPENDSVFGKLLIVAAIVLVGIIVLMGITVVLAAVIAAFVFGMTGNVQQVANPAFILQKSVDDSTYTITLVDMGGATSIKGLWIESPALDQPTLVSPDTSLYIGQSVTFSVRGQVSPVHVIAMSIVDGSDRVILDTYD